MSPLRVLLETDGGSRGNPGPAGFGAVVLTADGSRSVLAERSDSIGQASNNVAEYQALIAGLRLAAELGAAEVDVRADSKLVVEQMSGRWRIKHADMQALAEQARELLQPFDRVSFTWIPRAENAHADRLANAAMDRAAGKPPAPEPPAPAPPGPGWTGATGRPTRLLLLRHGQTALSVQRRYSGRGNPELTELGRQQAVAAGLHVTRLGDIAAVVSSPLGRARQTADAAADALGVAVTVHEGLTETDFGQWEGLTFGEAAERDPELHRRWLADTAVAPPAGESFDAVHRRVAQVRDELVRSNSGTTVLVVSHVTPIKTLLRMALDCGPSLLYRLHLDLASLSIAEFYPDGGASVRLVNETSYLAEGH